MLFYPNRQLAITPDFIGLSYRDIYINDELEGEATLHGWWLQADVPAKGVIYFLHGNGGNISTNLGSVFWLVERGYHVFMLDYSGYGYSEGGADVSTAVRDVQRGWRWLAGQAQQLPVSVMGQSMGAAIAGYAMTDIDTVRRPAAIVLDSGFYTYSAIARDVAAGHWLTWLFQWPAAWSMPRGYDLLTVIGELAATYPVLIMHSRDDAVVPFYHAEKLLEVTKGQAELYAYRGPHVSAFKLLENRDRLLDFLAKNR